MSITGRDGYIVAQALYQACKWQEQMKDAGSTFYEWSNHQDMKAILNEAYPSFAAAFVGGDQLAGRTPANLEDEKRAEEKEEANV